MALVPPDSLKPLHAYVKLAADNDTRDPVIAYWIRYYVVHKAMKLDKSSPEAVSFLTSMMDLLESVGPLSVDSYHVMLIALPFIVLRRKAS